MLINETLEIKKVIHKAATRHKILGWSLCCRVVSSDKILTLYSLSLKKKERKKNELTKQHRFVIYSFCQG